MRGFALHLRQCHAMQCNASRAVKHFHSVGPTVQGCSRSPDSVSITQWVCGAQVLPCNRQESPLPNATDSSVCREAAQDTVSPSDHSGRVKLVLQAENATVFCPRRLSCLGSWPALLRESIGSISYQPRSRGFFGFARAFWSDTAMRKYLHQVTRLYISLDLKQVDCHIYMKPS